MSTLGKVLVGAALLGSTLGGTAMVHAGGSNDGPELRSTAGAYYHVYYRKNCGHPWRLYGCYRCYHTATYVADCLEHRGYDACVS